MAASKRPSKPVQQPEPIDTHATLQTRLNALYEKKQKLQTIQFKTQEDRLKLTALEVMIGMILLDIEGF